MMEDRTIVVTGMGAVTAQGVGVRATWDGIVAGREVIGVWDGVQGVAGLEKVKVARCGEVGRPGDLPMRLWGKLSRTQQLACVAADEALGQAGLPRKLDRRGGLFVATTVCGMDLNERFYAQWREGKAGAEDDLMRRLMPWEVGELLARRHGTSGEAALRQVCMTTCVGSAMAIGNAMDALALGECEVAIAGGSEALCRVVLSGFNALRVVAAEGCRPFDEGRPGITVGEGAGMVVLERWGHARARGAAPLAVVGGVGMTCDAHHVTAPDPEAKQAVAAIREALARAGKEPHEIGYVNAHGTGTKDNDAMESRALREVFGEEGVFVSSTKRLTGHTFGAAGVIEMMVCVQAVREGVAPANAGSVKGEALGVKVVRGGAVRGKIGAALSTNFAFGGNNAAVVICRAG